MTNISKGASIAITNVTAVLPYSLVENATVVVEDGIITSIVSGGLAPVGAIDGNGALCIPGIVDSHSDGLEKEIMPRPNAPLPIDFALRSYEGRVRAAGVTTIFHGIGFENDSKYGRTIKLANGLCDAIQLHMTGKNSLVDHRILYRLDARDADGFDALQARFALDGSLQTGADQKTGATPLVSFEDHTPGQGQYTDRTSLEVYIAGNRKVSAEEARVIVDQTIIERDALLHNRSRALPLLTQQAQQHAIRLLAHDPATLDDVDQALEWHASIAEFPTTLLAAQAAHDAGLRTVCGAPNVLRGKSHSGNVSAQDLIRLGLCDGLASDYLPTTLLGAVGVLVADGVCSIPDAIRLITMGPADTVGLVDRGRLEIGARGDLALVQLHGRLPVVLGVFRSTSQSAEHIGLVGASQ
ncbi:MAG: alpha-D-ribose 1-methylphosphonate 5-triphosphate diphosphatase [bacterium]|nr:alpha-D-ribose 1-methylphosphonate 5-triphosphate diphosphatase [bacterium]